MKKQKKTYSPADPFPISEVAKASNFGHLIHIYKIIINLSLWTGIFPVSEKTAIIKPLLKPGLDHNELNSYRPVSALTFLSKLIESAVLLQLNDFISTTNVIPKEQSAYRKAHSTETALTKVLNDIMINMGTGNASLLILLDNSSAFDTVDHSLFNIKLKEMGLSGVFLNWFDSFFANRKFSVMINNTFSSRQPLGSGLAQGSSLGPYGFMLYTSDLKEVLKDCNVSYHLFADDLQVYIKLNNVLDDIPNIEVVLGKISEYMQKNFLKLNETKTKILLIGNRPAREKVLNEINHIVFNNTTIEFETQAKNLGVLFDEEMLFEKQIDSVVRQCNYDLFQIKFIKRYINRKSLLGLIYSLVHSKLDYCNALYYDLPKKLLHRMHLVFTKAARLIFDAPQRARVTPLLIQLHWLPVKARIIFKICCMVYKVRQSRSPEYLDDILTKYQAATNVTLRNQIDKTRLKENTPKNKWDDRAFYFAAPNLFNKLSPEIREAENFGKFKRLLKTHLFEVSYNLEDETIVDTYSTR